MGEVLALYMLPPGLSQCRFAGAPTQKLGRGGLQRTGFRPGKGAVTKIIYLGMMSGCAQRTWRSMVSDHLAWQRQQSMEAVLLCCSWEGGYHLISLR